MARFTPEESRLMREAQVRELKAVYAKAEKDLKRIVDGMTATDFQKARAGQLLAQVRQVSDRLKVDGLRWARRQLPEVYEEGVDFASQVMARQGLPAEANLGAQVHTRAVDALVRRAAFDVVRSADSMPRFFGEFVRRTQQMVLEEGVLNRELAAAILKGETRKAASDRILVQLMKRMEGQQFIEAGRYSFTPEYYSELVARTRIIEASSDATLALNQEFGNDLVQVSRHEGVDPGDFPCRAYQGRVFATNDDDPDFPRLPAVPPFHPHCRHIILPVVRRFLERRGTIEPHKKLSRDLERSVDSPADFQRALEGVA